MAKNHFLPILKVRFGVSFYDSSLWFFCVVVYVPMEVITLSLALFSLRLTILMLSISPISHRLL